MDCLKYFEGNSYPSCLQCLMVNSNTQDFYHSPCYFYDLRSVRLTSCGTAIEIPELGTKSITQHKKTCGVKVWTFTKTCTKMLSVYFYRCTVHFDIYKVHYPTNALCIKLDKILKFTLKTTLVCSYMFRSTTIIREPSLEPS